MDQIVISLLYVAALICAMVSHRRSLKADSARIAKLIAENAELSEVHDTLLGMAHLLEETNYRLAVECYGKAAVDQAIGKAGKSARN
jgi:hypothetical protein